jgi:hypothetical protein
VELSKWYSLASPGLHAIILVVQVGRFTEEEQKTVDICMKLFGEELKSFLIIVFTHKDRLEAMDMTIGDFVRTLDKTSNLKALIDETDGRYTAIGYKEQQYKREQEVHQILSMIDKMGKANGGSYYSNAIFKRVENIMKENERKRMKEVKSKGKMYTEEEVLKFIHAARSNTRVEIMNHNQQEEGLLSKVVYTVSAGILAVTSTIGRLLGF